MKRFGLSLIFAGFALAASAQSQYAAKVTVNSGNSFVVRQLNIEGDRLYPDAGQSSTALSMISSIEFRFSGISLTMCENMFYTGDRKALESLLNQYVGPVAKHSNLPTNLGEYLVWMVRASYWNGNHAAMARTIGQIRASGVRKDIDFASLYFTLLLMDQGKVENAKTVFESVSEPESLSVPLVEYIRGKFALEAGDARGAMRHVAKILAFHSRDSEWLPAATELEARIYQRLGQPEKAAAVARELRIAYPGTKWSRAGEMIEKESNGT